VLLSPRLLLELWREWALQQLYQPYLNEPLFQVQHCLKRACQGHEVVGGVPVIRDGHCRMLFGSGRFMQGMQALSGVQ
jgi:hypothetical protein